MNFHTKDVEILTKQGWLRFDALPLGEAVAQVSPLDLEMSFVVPDSFSKSRYKGLTYHWQNLSIDTFIAPQNQIVMQSEWMFQNEKKSVWQFIQAKDVPARFYIPQAVSWTKSDIKTIEFAGEKLCADDYLCFMGAWISEGCTRETLKDVVISQDCGKFAEMIWNVLKRLPFGFRRVSQGAQRPNHLQFKSSDRRLFEALKPFGKSGDKYIPAIIKEMSVRQIELFLLWYGLGDGHQPFSRPLVWHYVSKSHKLIDDIQELLLRTGKTGCAQKYENCSRIETRVHKQKCGRNYKWYGKLYSQNRKLVDFDDILFSVSVPHQAVLVRRNGRPYVV